MKRGFVTGTFDLLHPGHLHFFRECHKRCDHLTAALHVDPTCENKEKNKPIQTVYERYAQLRACKYIDTIVPYQTEEDLCNMLATDDYDVRFLGGDYQHGGKITGQYIVPIEYIPREHGYSSSELRSRL